MGRSWSQAPRACATVVAVTVLPAAGSASPATAVSRWRGRSARAAKVCHRAGALGPTANPGRRSLRCRSGSRHRSGPRRIACSLLIRADQALPDRQEPCQRR